MTYITSIERLSMQQGVQQGMQQGMQQGVRQGLRQGVQRGVQQGLRQSIMAALRVRFGEPPASLVQQLETLEDVEALRGVLLCVLTAETLAEVTHRLASNDSVPEKADLE